MSIIKPVLEIRNIYKKYDETEVLRDISFSIGSGDVVGLIGPNGAGKSTLMKIITGLVRQDQGEVIIGEYSMSSAPKKALVQIGAIIETPAFYPYLSGYDNLMLRLRMNSQPDKALLEKIIDQIAMRDKIHKKVKTYSLGMKQRLGIGYMLTSNPKLMLLDEPTNGLDVNGVIEFRELIKRISEENDVAILVSSHILAEVEKICNRIIFINSGSIIRQSSSGDAQSAYKIKTSDNKKAFELIKNNYPEVVPFAADDGIILEGDIDMAVLMGDLKTEQLELYSFTANKKSLEDEYMMLNNGEGKTT